jgi:hypothetical protein
MALFTSAWLLVEGKIRQEWKAYCQVSWEKGHQDQIENDLLNNCSHPKISNSVT